MVIGEKSCQPAIYNIRVHFYFATFFALLCNFCTVLLFLLAFTFIITVLATCYFLCLFVVVVQWNSFLLQLASCAADWWRLTLLLWVTVDCCCCALDFKFLSLFLLLLCIVTALVVNCLQYLLSIQAHTYTYTHIYTHT